METGECRMQQWRGEEGEWHINVMEIYAVLDALRFVAAQGKLWNACIKMVGDNTAVCGWLKKLGGNSKAAQWMLREVAYLLVQQNAYVVVTWVSTHDNVRPDALSRGPKYMAVFMKEWAKMGLPLFFV